MQKDRIAERVNGQRTKGWTPFPRALLYHKDLRAQERIVLALLEASKDGRASAIAASAGLTRQGAYKVLKRLVERGLVVYEARRYRIGEVRTEGGFVKAPWALLANPELTPQEKVLWLAIRDAQDWGNPQDWTFVRPKTLAARLGLPRRSVALALARLRAKGALREHPDAPGFIQPALPPREGRAEVAPPPRGVNKLPTPSGQNVGSERNTFEYGPLYTQKGDGRSAGHPEVSTNCPKLSKDCQGVSTNCPKLSTNCQGNAAEMRSGTQKAAPPIEYYLEEKDLEKDLEEETEHMSCFPVRGKNQRPEGVATPEGAVAPPETERIPIPPTEVTVDRHPGRVVVTVNEVAAVEVRATPRSFFHWIEENHPFFADLVRRDMATRLRFMRKFSQAEIEELADAEERREVVPT